MTGGGVELYEYGLNATGSIRIDSIAVGAGGDYAFAPQPIGQYLVRAIPDGGLYPGTATSYHTSTYYWGYADVVHSLCDTIMVADIQLVSTGNLNGTGYLEGYLGDLGIIRSEGPGDPWPGQGIVLEHWPAATLAGYVRTDANGVFQFQNVPYGTYRILVDHPGLPMLSYYIVTLDANTPSITGLAHGADPLGVSTFTATSIGTLAAVQVQLVPNPAQGGEVVLVGWNRAPTGSH
ncbi:MAG: carboxypeptidase regulatory-like domain-containing protein [Flavobacteriales bacterium]|nr:carboxypeptidase regulatory-like domain-containing protein [Flavobacteriales bacterium]